MAGAVSNNRIAHQGAAASAASPRAAATSEPFWVRVLLIALALAFFGIFLLMPLAVVFTEAMKKGWAAYTAGIASPDAISAIKLTLLVAGIAVPLNLIFGRRLSLSRGRYGHPGFARALPDR